MKKLPKRPPLRYWLYHIYVQIVSRLGPERKWIGASLPPVPCQFCGGNHLEEYCPKAKEMGFLKDRE